MEEGLTRWDKALSALEVLYKDIEKRSLSLPAFSLLPFAIFFWNLFKFYWCLILDLLLLLPMNAVIFIRNIFPGKWNYRSFSARYWKYVITWIWRGELPFGVMGIIRPLVMLMVTVHVYNRIRTVNRYIYLDDSLSEDNRIHISNKVKDILEHWERPTVLQVVYSYILPTVGLLIELYKNLFPTELPQWTSFLGYSLISYLIGFVISAFMVKRALMLGGHSNALYFPGAIPGNQCYSIERDIFDTIGISKKEFPFDILLSFVSFALGFWSHYKGINEPLYKVMGTPIEVINQETTYIIVNFTIFTLLSILALYRRRAIARC
jgi:hypothetical protein